MRAISNNPFQAALAQAMAGMRPDRAPLEVPTAPEPPPIEPDVYTLRQAAQKCQVSIPTFKSFGIPYFKKGQIVRIRKQDVETYLAGHLVVGKRPPADDTRGQPGDQPCHRL